MLVVGEGFENGLRRAINRTVRFNQLNRGIKLFAWNFRETLRNLRILGSKIVNKLTSYALPAAYPERAKPAMAVINHQRLWRWGGDAQFMTAIAGFARSGYAAGNA